MKNESKRAREPVGKQVAANFINVKISHVPPRKFNHPLYGLITTILIVFSVETIVMFVLPAFKGLHPYMKPFVNASLLALLLIPTLYVYLFRPIRACVNEYMRTEDNLFKEKEFISVAINSLPGVFYLIDDKGKILMWNKNAETVSGYSNDEISGMSPEDFFLESDKEILSEAISEALEKGRAYAELNLLSKGGKVIPYYFTGSRSVFNSTRHIVGMGLDITEIKETQEALFQAKREWENIFQAIGHPVILLDPDQNIITANRATLMVTGKTLDEVTGRKCYEIFHGTDRAPDTCPFRTMLDSGNLETEAMEMEALGGIYLVSCTPVRDEEGNLQKVIHIATDITKRKKAEEALQKSYSLLSSLVESPANVFILSLDRNYNYTFFNDAHKKEMKKVWGVDIEKYINILNCIPDEEDRDRARQNFERVLNGEHFRKVQQYGEPGNMCWYELAFNPIYDAENNISGITVFIIDITDRKKAEAALALEKQRCEDVASFVNCGLMLLDDQVRIIYANRLFEEWFGPFNEIKGKKCNEVIMLNDSEKECPCIRALRTQEIVRSERFVRKIDGELKYFYLIDSPVKDSEGNVSQITSVIVDITERKKAEDALKETSIQLNTIIESLPFDIFCIDKQGQYFIQNSSSRNTWGDFLGKQPEDVAPDKETLALWKDNNRRAFSGETVRNEVKFPLPDGRLRYFFNIITPIHDEREIWGILGINIDTTKRRIAEDELKKAKKELEILNRELEKRVREKTEELLQSQARLIQNEKLAGMGRMAGGLAHELNSPLAGLLPLLEKYRDQAPKGSEQYLELSLMYKAGRHMARIVKDFGVFSREKKIAFIQLDLNRLIEDTLGFISERLRHKGIRLIKEYDDRIPAAHGSRTELQQVVINMITNASDAMPEGGDLKIRTGMSTDKASVIMEFIDTGTGIKEEDIDKIFEPFFTTKEVGEGTGLGLSISYGIVKEHRGNIQVQSEPGKGTSFKIILPAAGSMSSGAEQP